MGLTIHYTLALSALLTPAEVVERMRRLRDVAASLPFESVTDVHHLDARAIAQLKRQKTPVELLWQIIQHEQSIAARRAPDGSYRLADPGKPAEAVLPSPPDVLIGFTAHLGEGCESAGIYVADNPGILTVDPPLLLPGDTRWRGRGFCKMQYAAAPHLGGVTNFLRCHLAVIALLDAAREHGFEVIVGDEGGYHDDRNVPELVGTVGEWNEVVSQLGAQLREVFGSRVVVADDQEQGTSPDRDRAERLAKTALDLIRVTNGTVSPMEHGDGR